MDVHVGDYVLAINGRELKAGTDPYELLQAPANQPVEWRVCGTPDGKAARTIRYQPLASETALLYLKWATDNRARVDALSHGRLAYIHLPDMGAAGLREFIKWWYPQVRKEGLLVDVRDNGGGNVSQMLIERLARTLQGTGFARNHEYADTYPRTVQPGPKAALINEDTASDGDIFSYAFRQWKLGAAHRQAHLGRRGRHHRARAFARRRNGIRAGIRDGGRERSLDHRGTWGGSGHRGGARSGTGPERTRSATGARRGGVDETSTGDTRGIAATTVAADQT